MLRRSSSSEDEGQSTTGALVAAEAKGKVLLEAQQDAWYRSGVPYFLEENAPG
eukprot:CAMPEP_0181490690 /NCGR_PEP_ID=MMETSP1110-20121109/49698_1 /TAXON_ID=174948 /ORGANISM="Symbiodinium sp., Strain CCMP421" /LENGTH=52 /DNA_ID=CAMNT_0023617703 /DNA_START=23 /DNA_END=179 /DNA_ORIENTATION=-